MRKLCLEGNVLTLGLLLLGSTGVASSAMSGEILHRVAPSPYVEAPVEPAPPNAGYYPTRWNRWDSEQAYLPGLRKARVPVETEAPREELPQPNGSAAPVPPMDSSKPNRAGETAPRPPIGSPKTTEPAPLPGGVDLPPLPGTPNQLPEPSPMPEKGVLPPPGQTLPGPGPDMLTPPPRVDAPPTQPKIEKPREPEVMPPPMELPPPQSPKAEKPLVPEPKEPELKLPDSKQSEPKIEPGDNLFEAPPRSGDKDQTKGAALPERPSIHTIQAKGKWVAIGTSARNENRMQQEIAPVSDTEEATVPTAGCARGTCAEGQPARLPAHDEAIPLSAVNQRSMYGQTAPAAASAMARFIPVRDAAVRPVSHTEPVTAGTQPLPNPLRRP